MKIKLFGRKTDNATPEITNSSFDRFIQAVYELNGGMEVYLHLVKNQYGKVIEIIAIPPEDIIKLPLEVDVNITGKVTGEQINKLASRRF